MAAIRTEYRYEVIAEDPGGANDPLSYTLTSRPMGMTAVGNTLVWTPEAATRGRTFSVVLRVEDEGVHLRGARGEPGGLEVGPHEAALPLRLL